MNWLIDLKINLSATASKAEWQRQTLLDMLQKEGLDNADANAYADFVISEKAVERDCVPEDHLSESQWSRLSLA